MFLEFLRTSREAVYWMVKKEVIVKKTWIVLLFGLGCSHQVSEIAFNADFSSQLSEDLKERFQVRTSDTDQKKKVFEVRRVSEEPIGLLEKLVFGVQYFGIETGHLVLEVLPWKWVNGRKVYHMRGVMQTASWLSRMIYRMDATMESFMDYESLFSHRFHFFSEETKRKKATLEIHDAEKTYFLERSATMSQPMTQREVSSAITLYAQDHLSALFYVRHLSMRPGSRFSFPLVSEGRSHTVECVVLRRELRKTVMGSVQTLVLQPQVALSEPGKKKTEHFLWINDDGRKMPVRLEVKTPLGSLVAVLNQVHFGYRELD